MVVWLCPECGRGEINQPIRSFTGQLSIGLKHRHRETWIDLERIPVLPRSQVQALVEAAREAIRAYDEPNAKASELWAIGGLRAALSTFDKEEG